MISPSAEGHGRPPCPSARPVRPNPSGLGHVLLVREPKRGQVASAGTFQVRDSGSWTFPMTSAADPHDFRTMEITLGPPSKNGELAGPVILSGQTL